VRASCESRGGEVRAGNVRVDSVVFVAVRSEVRGVSSKVRLRGPHFL
jgi:hypothetical protein